MRARFAFLIGLFFLTAQTAHAKEKCKRIDNHTVVLNGATNQKLLDCVAALDLSTVNTVIVNSGGGNVERAMEIGDRLAPLKPHIIIKKHCHSSCANYWLPLASKITFTKKARILLHGSIDPGILKKYAHKADMVEGLSRIIAVQDDYTTRHTIPRGWLLYRADYAQKEMAYAPYLDGTPSVPNLTKRISHIMVMAPMLESCLKGVEIIGFEGSYAAQATPSIWQRLSRKGQVSSGTFTCITPPRIDPTFY